MNIIYIIYRNFIDKKILILLIIIIIYSIPMIVIQYVRLRDEQYMNYLVPILVFIAIFFCILNYIINPGIVYSNNKCKEKIYCSHCKILYPYMTKGITHCYICQICVQGYHHHCGVIGKCVGKINKPVFIIFPFTCLALKICSILIIVYLIK